MRENYENRNRETVKLFQYSSITAINALSDNFQESSRLAVEPLYCPAVKQLYRKRFTLIECVPMRRMFLVDSKYQFRQLSISGG
ncbi:MAG: hypothetical protein Q8O19_02515 [Rectinemataceae bacterium]|nr:hypothetical protein [Rectinemataceae bacterium]